MANERVLISPGVLTREIDQTILPADTVGAGTCFIGPRSKGPAFVPTVTKDLDTDVQFFGYPNTKGIDFLAYANRTYLRQQANPSTTIRLLGMSDTGVNPGYSLGTSVNAGIYAICASGTLSSSVIALIAASGAVTLNGVLTSSVNQLAIAVAGFNGGNALTASLQRGDVNYIKKVFNTDPSQFAAKAHYVVDVFDYADKTALSGFVAVLVGSSNNFQESFITGASTTVISQPFAGTEYNLFGVGSIFAGDSANREVKITISNIKASVNALVYEYGSFAINVRAFGDNDKNPVILESFSNLNLDPTSANFVSRRIGDRFKVWNKTKKKFDQFGQYQNQSKYIYICPSIDLINQNVPATALPWGFAGYQKLNPTAFGNKAVTPPLPIVQALKFKGDFNTKVCWGSEIILNASGSINYGIGARLAHLFPSTIMGLSGTTDNEFSLKYVSGAILNVAGFNDTTRITDAQISSLSTSLAYATASLSPSTSGSGGFTGYLSVANLENTSIAKFTFPISNGFDGIDITLSNPFDPAQMLSTSDWRVYAYRTAIDMISNPDETEFTEVVMPGVYPTLVTNYGIDMVENRGDMFYLLDVSGSSVPDVRDWTAASNYDTNYASCYYPYLKINDDINGNIVEVPPTCIIPAVYAFSDKVSFPWFAPAGYTRAALKNFGVVEVKDKVTKLERDTLYDNRINPIASFPQSGPVVWGQKTLQLRPSALDRVNVRRMLLRVRKFIANVASSFEFEANNPSTWSKFINKVQPYLETVRQNAGLVDFKVIMDNTTNTQDLIDRNIMYGKLAIKPTRVAEYIELDFFVTNNVAGFSQ